MIDDVRQEIKKTEDKVWLYEDTDDKVLIKVTIAEKFPEQRPPSNFYALTAMMHYAFFRTKSRRQAQDAADKMYGKGKYTIRTCGF